VAARRRRIKRKRPCQLFVDFESKSTVDSTVEESRIFVLLGRWATMEGARGVSRCADVADTVVVAAGDVR
jgi:hypothetical protein